MLLYIWSFSGLSWFDFATMPKRNLTLLQLFCEMVWHRSCDEEMDRSSDNTAQSHIVLNYSNPQTWEGFQRQQADSRCIYASLILLVKVRVEGQCHQAWLCNVNAFPIIQVGVALPHSTMLLCMVTEPWSTFSLVQELVLTWHVMQDRQLFILPAGEQQLHI